MTANRSIWKLYHGSMPIVNTRVISQLWYMEVIPWLWLLHSLHSGQTVVYVVCTTGGAFDLYSSHSTSMLRIYGYGQKGDKHSFGRQEMSLVRTYSVLTCTKNVSISRLLHWLLRSLGSSTRPLTDSQTNSFFCSRQSLHVIV